MAVRKNEDSIVCQSVVGTSPSTSRLRPGTRLNFVVFFGPDASSRRNWFGQRANRDAVNFSPGEVGPASWWGGQ
jgi:hypothetical protein